MAKAIYTAHATVKGGRVEGHGRTSDGGVELDLRIPKELGGEGDGTNPEQLFAVGFAACFESALAAVARRERAEVGDVSIDSRVSLLPTDERGFKLAVELDVSLPQVPDDDQAARLVAGAHKVCPVLERHAREHRGDADGQRQACRLTVPVSSRAASRSPPSARVPTSFTVATVTCHAGRSPWYAVVFVAVVRSRVTTTYRSRLSLQRRHGLHRAVVGDPAAPELVVAGRLRGRELHRRARLPDAARRQLAHAAGRRCPPSS